MDFDKLDFTLQKQIKIYMVIPAFDPGMILVTLVEQLIRAWEGPWELEIVLVDDGSSRQCRQVFSDIQSMSSQLGGLNYQMDFNQYHCSILTHDRQKGKGAALKTAFSYIEPRAHAEDIIVLMDADGSHDPRDAIRLGHQCAREEWGIYLGRGGSSGGRDMEDKKAGFFRRSLFYLRSHTRLQDPDNSLRAFPASLLPFMEKVAGSRAEYEENMLIQAAKNQIPVREILLPVHEKEN